MDLQKKEKIIIVPNYYHYNLIQTLTSNKILNITKSIIDHFVVYYRQVKKMSICFTLDQ